MGITDPETTEAIMKDVRKYWAGRENQMPTQAPQAAIEPAYPVTNARPLAGTPLPATAARPTAFDPTMGPSREHAAMDKAISAINDGVVAQPKVRIGEPVDVLDRLPPGRPREVLERLRERLEDIEASYHVAAGKYFETAQARTDAKNAHRALTDKSFAVPYSKTRTVPLDAPEAIAAKRKADKAEEAFAKAEKRRDDIAGRMQPLRRLVERIERYVDLVPQNLLKIAPPLTGFRVPTADKLPAAIEAARESVAEVKADEHEIRSAAWPSSVIRNRAAAEIDMLAAMGRPKLMRNIDLGPAEGIPWAEIRIKGSAYGLRVSLPGDSTVDSGANRDVDGSALGLICWLFKDKILEAIDQELAEVSEDDAALSPEDRAERLTGVAERLLKAERIEAFLVNAADADHRGDIDVRAVLEIEGPDPAQW